MQLLKKAINLTFVLCVGVIHCVGGGDLRQRESAVLRLTRNLRTQIDMSGSEDKEGHGQY
jgi:hypothetical protein